MASPLRTNMLALVHSYLDVINNQGPKGLAAVMTPDFTLTIAPQGLGLTPPDNLEGYIQLLLGTQQATGSTNTKFVLADGFEP